MVNNDRLIGIRAGRTWRTNGGRILSLQRVYLVQKVGSSDVERDTLPAGVPARGSVHPDYDYLFVTDISCKEGDDSEKQFIEYTVSFSSESDSALSDVNKALRGADIQSWGWTSGNVTRDLTNNIIDNSPITNSAGQPFASPITYEAAAPVFRKVFKTKSRRNWSGYVNRINFADVTIGGETFAACTVRVTRVDCEKLWDDPFGFAYQYTIEAQVMHNNVTIGASSNLVDIGWDIAVLDCGCYYLAGDKLKRITVINEETGEESPATTPQMLNGEGGKLTGDLPYNIRVRAYPTATFPADFWSDTPRYAREIN